MSYRLTIFTDATCTTTRDIAELHGREARRFEAAMQSQGINTVECRTYRSLGIRVDDMLDHSR